MPPSKLQPRVRAAQHDVRLFASDLAPKTTKSPLVQRRPMHVAMHISGGSRRSLELNTPGIATACLYAPAVEAARRSSRAAFDIAAACVLAFTSVVMPVISLPNRRDRRWYSGGNRCM